MNSLIVLCLIGLHNWFEYKERHRVCWQCGKEQELIACPDFSFPVSDDIWFTVSPKERGEENGKR